MVTPAARLPYSYGTCLV